MFGWLQSARDEITVRTKLKAQHDSANVDDPSLSCHITHKHCMHTAHNEGRCQNLIVGTEQFNVNVDDPGLPHWTEGHMNSMTI